MQQSASVVSGNSVVVKSDAGNIDVIGSSIAGTQGVDLLAQNGAINVLAGLDTNTSHQESSSRQIGSLGSNGTATGFSVGVSKTHMVQDTAAEGVNEAISFLLDSSIIVFASNDTPNTMDPSFMKTFRLMGQWMKPGSYTAERGDEEVLKMDWYGKKLVTNSAAGVRINANAS